MIIHWPEDKLTWHRLIEAIELEIGINLCRQTLASYYAIKKEYQLRKSEQRGITTVQGKAVMSVAENELLKRINKLERDNAYLRQQCSSQLEKLQCIIHNAQRHSPRIDLRKLTLPLPKTIKQ